MQGETDEPSLVALFTFVARDPLTGKAVAVNSLQPATESDRAHFAERQAVAQQRRAVRKAASAAVPAGVTALLSGPLAKAMRRPLSVSPNWLGWMLGSRSDVYSLKPPYETSQQPILGYRRVMLWVMEGLCR